jgi:hypothetical protein
MNRMNRKNVLTVVASLGLVLGITSLALMVREKGRTKVSVSFLKREPSQGEFPTYIAGERFDFEARNPGAKPVSIHVSAIEDQPGHWISPPPHNLGQIQARETSQLYLYAPMGLHPRSVRLRVYEQASLWRKTQIALNLLLERAAGRYTGKQVWFNKMEAPTYDLLIEGVSR